MGDGRAPLRALAKGSGRGHIASTLIRALPFILLALCAGIRISERYFCPDLRVDFLDVGQGDAALIRFPGDEAWLVDAGDASPHRRADIFLELARRGILHLDAAVLSHPDLDHIGGFEGLAGNISIGLFYYHAATPPADHPVFARLAAILAPSVARWEAVASPRAIHRGGVRATLTPLRAGKSKNNQPLVLSLEFAGCRFLLAGDAERRAEAQWAARRPGAVHVLKANHHGSRTSSSNIFLRELEPRWTVISSGTGNRYGHPAREVLERLLPQTEVLRTDFEGEVSFTVTPGGSLRCRSTRGPCGQTECGLPVADKVDRGLEDEA